MNDNFQQSPCQAFTQSGCQNRNNFGNQDIYQFFVCGLCWSGVGSTTNDQNPYWSLASGNRLQNSANGGPPQPIGNYNNLANTVLNLLAAAANVNLFDEGINIPVTLTTKLIAFPKNSNPANLNDLLISRQFSTGDKCLALHPTAGDPAGEIIPGVSFVNNVQIFWYGQSQISRWNNPTIYGTGYLIAGGFVVYQDVTADFLPNKTLFTPADVATIFQQHASPSGGFPSYNGGYLSAQN